MPKPVVIIIAVVVSFIAVVLIIAAALSIKESLTNPRPVGMPRNYPCVINVTQEGTPLEGATVTLHPVDQELAKWGLIRGTTDAKGDAKIKIEASSNFDDAFKGDYKVTITKTERPGDPNIAFVNFVDPEFGQVHTTPASLTVSRATKGKIDLGPAVRIERKSPETQRQDDVKALLADTQPCKITILQDGKPVSNAEVTLEGDFMKYARLNLNFKGTTDSQGVATIVTASVFTSRNETETYPEAVPVDTFEVKVKVPDANDIQLRFGKKLGTVTIADEPFEKEYDLKDFRSSTLW